MKIVGTEVSDSRRNKRVDTIAIEIEIEDTTYTTLDWSLGGFLVDGYQGNHQSGDEIIVGISVTVGDKEYCHVARAEIIRIEAASNQLAANFLELDNATVDTLDGWMTGRLRRQVQRGKSAS